MKWNVAFGPDPHVDTEIYLLDSAMHLNPEVTQPSG